MRIRELRLQNYRPFTDTLIKFQDQFTVIAGINGRGKTAILEALALLLSRLLPQISAAKGGYRSFSVEDIHGDHDGALLAMRVSFPLPAPTVIFGGTFVRRTARQTFPPLLHQVAQTIKDSYGADKRRSTDAAPIAVYYTTDRAGFTKIRSLTGQAARGQSAAYHRALVKTKVDYKDFIRRYRVMVTDLQGTEKQNALFIGRPAVHAVHHALQVFLGEFTVIGVDANPPRMLLDKAGTRLSLGQLSDGERSFLAMVTDLCRRLALANPELDDPLQGEGVVLIDELELHLHPKWQREAVEKLRKTFPRIQFIATTHSPFVVQSLRKDELWLLDDQVLGDYENRGLEEVVSKVMGIAEPNVTPRYCEMLDVAKEYFALLERVKNAPSHQIHELKQRLSKLVQPYADNPAYQAFLEMNATAALKE